MASILTPPRTSTAYLLAELKSARGWQRCAIAEVTETPVAQVQRWDADDLDALNPEHRRQVETILSTASTLPWWSRAHA